MKISIQLLGLFLLSGLIFLLIGCADQPLSPHIAPITSVAIGGLRGQVFDQTGAPLSGALISAESHNTISSSRGYYTFSNMTVSTRLLVNASKPGYIPVQKVVVSPPANENLSLDIYLHQSPASQPVDLTAGGSASNGGGQIILIAGTTMEDSDGNPVSGSVDVVINAFDPSDNNDQNIFPGIFAGRTITTGTDQPFESFGFLNISITKSGSKVNLAHNATAEVIIPVSSSFLGHAPLTIEVWSYNDTGGYWIREGIATLVGSNYVAVVSHFSWINCDWPYKDRYGFIKGRVVNGSGNPEPNRWVVAWGNEYGGHASAWSQADGTFSIPVICNSSKTVTLYNLPDGYTCEAITTSEPLVPGNLYTLPKDLVVTYEGMTGGGGGGPVETIAKIELNYRTGGTPFWWYLRGHLSGPVSGGGSRFLIHPTGPLTGSDATMTSYYNPTSINIADWHQGVYRLCVENITTSGSPEFKTVNMATSEADVTLTTSTEYYIFNIPSVNPSNMNIWKVFNIYVDAFGDISSVETLNTYVNSTQEVSPEPYLYP